MEMWFINVESIHPLILQYVHRDNIVFRQVQIECGMHGNIFSLTVTTEVWVYSVSITAYTVGDTSRGSLSTLLHLVHTAF